MTDLEDDPYVVYQLRKPHQRGTAIVPRLVPKSHAPAFSHANYRFARVAPPESSDDALLYLPKSLEYPSKWDSFGSESSIWSASSLASAFPTKLTRSSNNTRTNNNSSAGPTARSSSGNTAQGIAQPDDFDDACTISSARCSSPAASLTERTSLLSSEGGRSLKSFIRFDAPHNAHALGSLQAPVPVRRPFVANGNEFSEPILFTLPPALSELEREDHIVQQVIDNSNSTRSVRRSSSSQPFLCHHAHGGHDDDDDDDAAAAKLKRTSKPHSPSRTRDYSPAPARSSSISSTIPQARPSADYPRHYRPPPATSKRRSMWAWLFGAPVEQDHPAEPHHHEQQKHKQRQQSQKQPRAKRVKSRILSDVRAAPIMDEEEERRRRAQFVRGARAYKSNNNNNNNTRPASWTRSRRERGVSLDSRRDERPGAELPSRRRSAWRLWQSFRRSLSFSGRVEQHNEDEQAVRTESTMKDHDGRREDSTERERGHEEQAPMRVQSAGNGPSDSFVRRKMQALRETTARRMAAAASEVGAATSNNNNTSAKRRSSTSRDPVIHPRERREDRPRNSRQQHHHHHHHHAAPHNGPALPSQTPGATMSMLDQLIAARPDLHSRASTESVENLASRISSDLSYGTGLTSVSERTASGGLQHTAAKGFFIFDPANRIIDPVGHSSAVSSVQSCDANSEASFKPGVQSIVCEQARSPITSQYNDSRRIKNIPAPWAPAMAVTDSSMWRQDGGSGAARKGNTGTNGQAAPLGNTASSLQRRKPLTSNAREKGSLAGGAAEPAAGKSIFMDAGLPYGGVKAATSPPRTRDGRGTPSDYNDPHATQLDVFCQCNCSCVYEAECKQSCDANSSRASTSTTVSRQTEREKKHGMAEFTPKPFDYERYRRRFEYSPSASSPSLSLLSGARKGEPRKNISEHDWQEAMRKRVNVVRARIDPASVQKPRETSDVSDPPLHSTAELRPATDNAKGGRPAGGQSAQSHFGTLEPINADEQKMLDDLRASLRKSANAPQRVGPVVERRTRGGPAPPVADGILTGNGVTLRAEYPQLERIEIMQRDESRSKRDSRRHSTKRGSNGGMFSSGHPSSSLDSKRKSKPCEAEFAGVGSSPRRARTTDNALWKAQGLPEANERERDSSSGRRERHGGSDGKSSSAHTSSKKSSGHSSGKREALREMRNGTLVDNQRFHEKTKREKPLDERKKQRASAQAQTQGVARRGLAQLFGRK